MQAAGAVPPHDESAELTLLASVLLKPEAFSVCADLVEAADFYTDRVRRCWEGLAALDQDRQPLEEAALGAWLKARNRYEQVGGTPFFVALTGVPYTANVSHYARRVRELARARAVLATLQQCAAEAYTEAVQDPAAWLEQTERALFGLATEAPRGQVLTYRDLANQAVDRVRRARDTGAADLARTGLYDWDGRLFAGGMERGELWIVGARPGVGKTALLAQLVEGLVETGSDWNEGRLVRPAFGVRFDIEMDPHVTGRRALSQRSGIPLTALRLGELDLYEWERLPRSAQLVADLPILVDTLPRLTPRKVRHLLRRHLARLRDEHNAPSERLLVVGIDYAQIMESDEPFREERERLNSILRELKLTAREFDVVILLGSQVKRPTTESKKDQRPTVSDLKGTGGFEEHADGIVLIHRPDSEATSDSEKDGAAELIIGKGRNTGQSRIHAHFAAQCARFEQPND